MTTTETIIRTILSQLPRSARGNLLAALVAEALAERSATPSAVPSTPGTAAKKGRPHHRRPRLSRPGNTTRPPTTSLRVLRSIEAGVTRADLPRVAVTSEGQLSRSLSYLRQRGALTRDEHGTYALTPDGAEYLRAWTEASKRHPATGSDAHAAE